MFNSISEAANNNLLINSELFVFTDNFAAESAFHKGYSCSRKLFQLMLTLQQLQMHSDITMHMVHIAGKGMISQGTDGLSRGSTVEDVMSGRSFLDFVPLHLNVLERQCPSLSGWVLS